MALNNFFSINLPYGMEKVSDNPESWVVFNREYCPLGFTDHQFFKERYSTDLPIRARYADLTQDVLRELAGEGALIKEEDGKIKMIFFYHDGSKPSFVRGSQWKWDEYLKRLQRLSALKIAQ